MSLHDDFEPEEWTSWHGDVFIACTITIICVLSALGMWAIKVKVGI